MSIPAAVVCLAVCLAPGAAARADTVYTNTFATQSGDQIGGVPVAAQASFTYDPAHLLLTVVLENVSPGGSGTNSPTSTLSGVFFDLTDLNSNLIDPNASMTVLSATVGKGSIVDFSCPKKGVCTTSAFTYNGQDPTDVSGEWGFQRSDTVNGTSPWAQHYAIGSAGYITTGLTGDIGNFNGGVQGANGVANKSLGAGIDLDQQVSLSNIDFGIIAPGASNNPNGGLAKEPLITDKVTFTIGLPAALPPQIIVSNVVFQYGTQYSESHFGGFLVTDAEVLEPGSLPVLALALLPAARRWTCGAAR